MRRQWWFGRLIRNTDMHPGNLSFEPEGARLRPSPAYDMLPMCHAPLPGGEVPERSFDAPLPAPEERDDWFAALPAALGFWRRAADDGRIGAAFRALCAANADALAALALHA